MKPISKYSYRRKLQVYYLSVFILFVLITGAFQFSREKTFRVTQIESRLDDICEISNNYITKNRLNGLKNFELLDSLKNILPQKQDRITVIGLDGKVLYDSSVKDFLQMDNHKERPEIQLALKNLSGVSTRNSQTTGKDYYYYAKKYDDYFIRSSIVYSMNFANFLRANKIFFSFIFGLFILVWMILWLVTRKFSSSIAKLQEFAINAGDNTSFDANMQFDNDELGVIGEQIVSIYGDLQKTKRQLSIEKERIFRHLNVVNQGIAIFSSEKELLLSNQHFINYIKLISDLPIKSETDIFKIHDLKKLHKKTFHREIKK